MAKMNRAYIAHIVADSPDGPRGDPILSGQLRDDLGNLMLLCDAHHRLIDIEDVQGHPVTLLHDMKTKHEMRIEMLTSIGEEARSEILLYGANIGDHASIVNLGAARRALAAERRYPASETGIALGMLNSSWKDTQPEFWRIESTHLRALFDERVRPRLSVGACPAISVFALAPQPLLMLLGYLLSDIPNAEVFQPHREPQGWVWQSGSTVPDYLVARPSNRHGSESHEPSLTL